MSTAFAFVGDVAFHIERQGDSGRPAIVFANSLGTDLRIWDALMPRLPATGTVLRYDMRGHGLSDAPPGPWSIDGHARDLVGLVDHCGIGRFALVGLSVGGMVAQAVAAADPDRVAALVLCDTAARIGDAAGWNARIAAVESGGLEAIADAVMERWFTPAYRTKETAAMHGWRNMLVRQPAHGYAAICAAIRDADLTQRAPGIRVPTLCVAGDQDGSTPPDLVRGTAALIPGARFALIAEAGHIPCVEQPAALATLIEQHLADAGWRG